jgi:hypothetical protein
MTQMSGTATLSEHARSDGHAVREQPDRLLRPWILAARQTHADDLRSWPMRR